MEDQNKELRNRALKRIKALLEKNEDNGATIEEAKSAMDKANQLMKEYYLTINDISDLDDDPIVTEETSIIKIKELTSQLYPIICKLFDLRHFYTNKKLTFVGYQTDVKLGIYLYIKIMGCLKGSISLYTKSIEYRHLKWHYGFHGSQLRKSFVEGFIEAIGAKVYDLFYERERRFKENDQSGLMIIKKDKVDLKFKSFNARVHKLKDYDAIVPEAFKDGVIVGKTVNLQNDLHGDEYATGTLNIGGK